MAIRRERCGSSVVIHRKSGYGSLNAFSSALTVMGSEGGIELSEGVESDGVSGSGRKVWSRWSAGRGMVEKTMLGKKIGVKE